MRKIDALVKKLHHYPVSAAQLVAIRDIMYKGRSSYSEFPIFSCIMYVNLTTTLLDLKNNYIIFLEK